MKRTNVRYFIYILTGIVIIATFLFGPGIVYQIINALKANQKPEFTFFYGGTIDPNTPIYEITEELSNSNAQVGKFKIIISASYLGKGLAGPVNIYIKPKNGESYIDVGQWTDFRSEYNSPKVIELTPSLIYLYSGIPERQPATYSLLIESKLISSNFDIVIFYNKTQLLEKRSITVVYTPWYHVTQLSDSTIRANEDVSAFIITKNLGLSESFNIIGTLYESTVIDITTLNIGSEGWWPGKTWATRKFYTNFESKTPIATNGEFVTELKIPGDNFVAGHTYVLETSAVKKLPYLDFGTKDWKTSEESWRPRDQPNYSTIVVLDP